MAGLKKGRNSYQLSAVSYRLKRWLLLVLAMALILAVAVACSGGDDGEEATEDVSESDADNTAAEVNPTFEPANTPAADGESAEEEADDGGQPGIEASGSEPGNGGTGLGGEGPGVGPKVEVTRTLSDAPAAADADPVPERAEAGGSLGESVEAPVTGVAAAELPEGSLLTAGAVDDNAAWDAYLTYLQNYQGPLVYPLDVSERHQLFVLDSLERPVLAALVTVFADGVEVARLRTHSDGRVYLFPSILPTEQQINIYDLTIEINGETIETSINTTGPVREWTVIHPAANADSDNVNLDVMFLLDATGSMGDEIQQLKDNIEQIATEIAALPSQPDVRFGMVIYRDRGDEFVVRTYDFTPDVATFALLLDDVVAAGGGDYPEDLNEALNQAVLVPEWRVEDTVSLMFLVADAPPHLDYQDQQFTYLDGLQTATELGIKIFPIASSNLDAQGEYVFRQLAQVSGGQFIFLTYGAGGPGTTGDKTDLAVEDYTVSALDELVIQIVTQELSSR